MTARARAVAVYGKIDTAARVDGATAGGLAVVLIETLLDNLDGLAGAIRLNQGTRLSQMRGRIESILLSLEASINPGFGALAEQLGTIYRSVRQLVTLAVADRDSDRCGQARELLEPIADAWRAIAKPDTGAFFR